MAVATLQAWHLILVLCGTAIFSRIISHVFHYFRQPWIIGDIVAGLLLGPSVLGNVTLQMFPSVERNAIRVLGLLGLMLASLTAGSNFDVRTMKGQNLRVFVYTIINFFVPTVLTIPLVLALPSRSSIRGPHYNPHAFFFFAAGFMSASALPFTFLILDELKLYNRLAKFVIAFSCLSTVLLFFMLSIAYSYAYKGEGTGDIPFRLGILLAIFVVLWFGQKIWGFLIQRFPNSVFASTKTDPCLAIVSLAFLAGVASDRVGDTFLIGAFLAGAFLPYRDALRSEVAKHIKFFFRWLLLPMFFLDIGLSFNLRTVKYGDSLVIFLVIVWATLAKLSVIPFSRWILRMSWREAIFSAAISNCRGFNGLVVAKAAFLSTGVFGDAMYIACIMLSLVSSVVAAPLAKKFQVRDTDDALLTNFYEDEEEQENESGKPGSPNTAPDSGSMVTVPLDSPTTAASAQPSGTAQPNSATQRPQNQQQQARAANPLLALGSQFTSQLMKTVNDTGRVFGAGINAVNAGLRTLQELAGDTAEPVYVPRSGLRESMPENVLILFLPDIVQEMMVFMPTVTQTLRHQTFTGVFRGSTAVDFLLASKNYPLRTVAKAVCNRMLHRGFMRCVHGAEPGADFVDGDCLYSWSHTQDVVRAAMRASPCEENPPSFPNTTSSPALPATSPGYQLSVASDPLVAEEK
eukprot:TRINITY_DN55430_c0_g1_i1.p1 TRINITY_DN55430_c0_g1~~TRINITY_DN55430_c0_g1_i1.p1  ORF type:complete len:688 (+),score=85.55 TRINITY_DN55430_c0_g1_i1:46-2109(+)